MKKVLAVTVGGEPDPIVGAIQQYAPNFVLFFVTTEPNGGSRRYLVEDTEKGHSILKRTGLSPDAYEIVTLPNPDDFEDCFNRINEALCEYEKSAADCLADYTGGTKTMAVALAIAAVLRGWSLSVVAGQRRDTVKVAKGTELARLVRIAPTRIALARHMARALYNQQEFAGAAAVLQELFSQMEIPGEESRRLNKLYTFLRGLAAWDRFAYEEALKLLRAAPEVWPESCRYLAQILGGEGLSYRAVEDLVGNAMRRAQQGRYEDAVLRLYRAVELLAQLRLAEHGLDPSNLDLDRPELAQLPEDLTQRLAQRKKEGRAWVGLREAYQILAALHDPVGQLFAQEGEKQLLNLLSLRNQLFLEHGMRPVGPAEWERAKTIARQFLQASFEALGRTFTPVDFPSWEEIAGL